MNSNVFFEQENKTFFGGRFDSAIEYHMTKRFWCYHVRFADKLILPEDPQNVVLSRPIDLVSECLSKLAQEKKDIIVYLYGRRVFIRQDSSANDVKEKIEKIQKKHLVKISKKVSPAIKRYLENRVLSGIGDMPVH